MIDIEGYVFDYVATATRSQFSGISVKSEYTPGQGKMPCVTVEQKDNFVVKNAISGERIENLASMMFEVNVYTNDGDTRKKSAKSIMSYVDGLMTAKGFVRTMLQPIPNLMDATIFRITARYTAQVTMHTDSSGNIDYVIYTS